MSELEWTWCDAVEGYGGSWCAEEHDPSFEASIVEIDGTFGVYFLLRVSSGSLGITVECKSVEHAKRLAPVSVDAIAFWAKRSGELPAVTP